VEETETHGLPERQPPPRTPQTTWTAGPAEEALIREFLKCFPADRAAQYEETLRRTDARLQMYDADKQQLLDAIYAERLRVQMAYDDENY